MFQTQFNFSQSVLYRFKERALNFVVFHDKIFLAVEKWEGGCSIHVLRASDMVKVSLTFKFT